MSVLQLDQLGVLLARSVRIVLGRVHIVDEHTLLLVVPGRHTLVGFEPAAVTLIGCVHTSEDDSNRARQENTKLVELQHVVIGDENTCVRDILKQAVAKASAVRDSLELARAENARLSRAITDKESAMQSLR